MNDVDIESIYRGSSALLEGHFLLSSGNHTRYYLQSAKVLENPKIAEDLAKRLAKQIIDYGLEIECICAPALGGIIAGYELARALGVRFIFTERVSGKMELRRGFSISPKEKVLICEDIITTGGSAMESASCVEEAGGSIVGFAGLANRGFCKRVVGKDKFNMEESKNECLLTRGLPFFALADFEFEMYDSSNCPLCKTSVAYKPGSRNNS